MQNGWLDLGSLDTLPSAWYAHCLKMPVGVGQNGLLDWPILMEQINVNQKFKKFWLVTKSMLMNRVTNGHAPLLLIDFGGGRP